MVLICVWGRNKSFASRLIRSICPHVVSRGASLEIISESIFQNWGKIDEKWTLGGLKMPEIVSLLRREAISALPESIFDRFSPR